MEERLSRVNRILFFASAIAFLWVFQESLSLLQQIVVTAFKESLSSLLVKVILTISVSYSYIVWPILDFLVSIGMLFLFYSIAQNIESKRVQQQTLRRSAFNTMQMKHFMQSQGESFKEVPSSLPQDESIL